MSGLTVWNKAIPNCVFLMSHLCPVFVLYDVMSGYITQVQYKEISSNDITLGTNDIM